MKVDRSIIDKCIKAREKAVLTYNSVSKVGAVLYDIDGNCYEGFNIQNRVHKSYHAEEVAILNAILQGANLNHMVGMVVSFTANIKELTFCCGVCRQLIWEYIRNPNFKITEVSLEGKIVGEKTIEELYPLPFPR